MTATIPENSEQLQDLFHDPKRLQAALEDGSFPGLVQAYVEKHAAANTDLHRQFDEQVQLGMQAWAQETGMRGFRPGASPVSPARARAIARSRFDARQAEKFIADQHLYNAAAPGAPADDEADAASLGRFVYATHKAERDAAKAGNTAEVTRIQGFKDRLNGLRNAMSERVPAEGGFLIPENLRSDILMVALESAAIRPRARVIPMDSLRVPLPAIDDVSHTSSVYGGVIGYWTEEGAALTASAPAWSRFVLEARKLTAYTSIPNELLQDSVTALDTWFNTFFPKAIAWFEDVAFISGTGTGEPQGIINAPGAVSVSTASDNTIAMADIIAAYTRMWPESLNNAVWLCSPDALVQLMQLALTTNSTTIAPPAWFGSDLTAVGAPGGRTDGYNYQLFGRPLIVSEKMPSSLSGNTTQPGALTFADLSYYLIGDRQSMQVASSDEYLFGQDMVAFRVIERLDGRFWLQSPITPENGSADTLSPLVLLNTTA